MQTLSVHAEKMTARELGSGGPTVLPPLMKLAMRPKADRMDAELPSTQYKKAARP